MKLIIAGSRTLELSQALIHELVLHYDIFPEELVCGMADGVDSSGFTWALYNDVDIAKFPALWDLYGKKAGCLRNAQMADYGDCLLLIWDGKSKGSANMKKEMKALGKPIYEVIL